MKIQFDIKYRPQIESGEYKVETRDGRPARVVCWDRAFTERYNNCNIVALVTGTKSKAESAYYYYQDGHLWDKANGEGDSSLDLFIITPEPELTEFEAAVMVILLEFVEEVDANDLKRISKELLELARKNISWYSVDEFLPLMDEEVIVLTNEMNGHTLPDASHLCFAHRPDPEVAVCYDGWNIPGVKYWMYCPELSEE